MFLKHDPFHSNMPSILNTPANKIPIHFFHLPVTQQEVLLVSVLTDPILYESIIASSHYRNDCYAVCVIRSLAAHTQV